jgi:hypothetical protein
MSCSFQLTWIPTCGLGSLCQIQRKTWCMAVWRIRDVYPGSRIRLFSIPDPGSELSPSRIRDPGVKKVPNPGSGSATLVYGTLCRSWTVTSPNVHSRIDTFTMKPYARVDFIPQWGTLDLAFGCSSWPQLSALTPHAVLIIWQNFARPWLGGGLRVFVYCIHVYILHVRAFKCVRKWTRQKNDC